MAIPLTGTIGVTAPSDTFATHLSTLGSGGHQEVADKAARNAITTERRRRGMMVFTQDDSKFWYLTGTTNTGTDADWTLFGTGTSAVQQSETFEFPTQQQTWVMNHHLDDPYPSVTFMELDGGVFMGAPEYTGPQQVSVTFEIPGGMAGRAVLRSNG